MSEKEKTDLEIIVDKVNRIVESRSLMAPTA